MLPDWLMPMYFKLLVSVSTSGDLIHNSNNPDDLTMTSLEDIFHRVSSMSRIWRLCVKSVDFSFKTLHHETEQCKLSGQTFKWHCPHHSSKQRSETSVYSKDSSNVHVSKAVAHGIKVVYMHTPRPANTAPRKYRCTKSRCKRALKKHLLSRDM